MNLLLTPSALGGSRCHVYGMARTWNASQRITTFDRQTHAHLLEILSPFMRWSHQR